MMLMRRMELLKERYLNETTGDWGSSLSGFLACWEAGQAALPHCSALVLTAGKLKAEKQLTALPVCRSSLCPVFHLPQLHPHPQRQPQPHPQCQPQPQLGKLSALSVLLALSLSAQSSKRHLPQSPPTSSSTSTSYSTWSCSSEVKSGITMCWELQEELFTARCATIDYICSCDPG